MAPLHVPGTRRRAATSEDPQLRRRLGWLAAFVGIWAALIAFRLVELQVVQRDTLAARARSQQQRTVVVPAHRGRILDRNGRALAETIEVPSLYADATVVDDDAGAARRLATILGRPRGWLRRQLAQKRSFVWLARQVSPRAAAEALDLDLDGLGSIPENRRYYPAGRLAAHVLGIAGIDGDGLEGIERDYNDTIGARKGKMISVRDGRGTSVLRYLERPSASGRDVQLTLDAVIQYHAEVELDRAMRSTRAAWGTVIVMEPASGAILAMAVRPSFNPNSWENTPQAFLRNRAVTDVFEPGSTMKVVVAAAALETGRVRPSEVLDCGRGSIVISGKTIRDHKSFDRLTFAEVIAESSNVGAIRVGTRLPPEEFHAFLRAFGFGEKTGIEMKGEVRGLLAPPDRWSGVSQASMSIGQEIATTPLQVLRAVAAVANGGVLPQPYIVMGGDRPTTGRPVISEQTARVVNQLLEGVVEHGTGKAAAVAGYRVAGKTGTAQKAEPGKGYGDRHVASFVGYVPSRDPALAMVIVLDSPKGGSYHGGDVAAPVFARVAMPALRRLGIAPEPGLAPSPPVEMAAAIDLPPTDAAAAEPLLRTESGEPVVPDLGGATLRGALGLLARAGLTAMVKGSGRVVSQHPAPGAVLPAGGVVRVLLSTSTIAAASEKNAPRGHERTG